MITLIPYRFFTPTIHHGRQIRYVWTSGDGTTSNLIPIWAEVRWHGRVFKTTEVFVVSVRCSKRVGRGDLLQERYDVHKAYLVIFVKANWIFDEKLELRWLTQNCRLNLVFHNLELHCYTLPSIFTWYSGFRLIGFRIKGIKDIHFFK